MSLSEISTSAEPAIHIHSAALCSECRTWLAGCDLLYTTHLAGVCSPIHHIHVAGWVRSPVHHTPGRVRSPVHHTAGWGTFPYTPYTCGWLGAISCTPHSWLGYVPLYTTYMWLAGCDRSPVHHTPGRVRSPACHTAGWGMFPYTPYTCSWRGSYIRLPVD